LVHIGRFVSYVLFQDNVCQGRYISNGNLAIFIYIAYEVTRGEKHFGNSGRKIVDVGAVFGDGTPFVLFCGENILAYYTLCIMFFIFYYVFSFVCYGVAGAPQLVQDAERNAKESRMEELTVSNEGRSHSQLQHMQRIEQAVAQWCAQGGYLRCDINMEVVAKEMDVTRDQLTAWLKTTEWELFSPWLAHLRIEYAKQLLCEHPEWTNEAIAEQSGFKSRIYFQQAFKKATGMTPTQFVKHSSQPDRKK